MRVVVELDIIVFLMGLWVVIICVLLVVCCGVSGVNCLVVVGNIFVCCVVVELVGKEVVISDLVLCIWLSIVFVLCG